MLNYWRRPAWDLDVDVCPCDVHFTRYLEEKAIRGASVFHFGTGNHHHVGIWAAESGTDNLVLAITANPDEHASFVRLAIDRPEVARVYKPWFADIYQLDARLLPELDVVTLFHLCEFRTADSDAYGAITDLELTRLLLARLRPEGLLLFYQGSSKFEQARPIIGQLEAEGAIRREGNFESLRVYRKPGPGPAPG